MNLKDKTELENEIRSVLLQLNEELDRLKGMICLGSELEVSWHPDEKSDIHGEVEGNLIRIYDSDGEEVIRTLRHEFIDHVITKELIDPFIKIINMQKRIIESMVYKSKERIVDYFSVLLEEISK